MPFDIPDAPWIEETMRTGYCRSGYWNTPPGFYSEDELDPDDDESEVDDDG